jgi:hypothetical protein
MADLSLVAGYRWHAIPNRMGGYYARASGGLYMHRLITGAQPGEIVDHWNHDTLDNRRVNLRVGTQVDNMRNGAFALKTHCPYGHPYDITNTYRYPSKNGRKCRECHRQDERRRLAQVGLTAEQKDRKLQRQRERRARQRIGVS